MEDLSSQRDNLNVLREVGMEGATQEREALDDAE
jgi:hypothetical protein